MQQCSVTTRSRSASVAKLRWSGTCAMFVAPTHGASAYLHLQSQRIPHRLHQPEPVSDMLFSSQDQDWLLPFWQEHITPVLGQKAARQFVRATQRPSNWLAETIIESRLFCPDWFGAVYYPVDLTKFSEGRNHHLAELIAT